MINHVATAVLFVASICPPAVYGANIIPVNSDRNVFIATLTWTFPDDTIIVPNGCPFSPRGGAHLVYSMNSSSDYMDQRTEQFLRIDYNASMNELDCRRRYNKFGCLNKSLHSPLPANLISIVSRKTLVERIEFLLKHGRVAESHLFIESWQRQVIDRTSCTEGSLPESLRLQAVGCRTNCGGYQLEGVFHCTAQHMTTYEKQNMKLQQAKLHQENVEVPAFTWSFITGMVLWLLNLGPSDCLFCHL